MEGIHKNGVFHERIAPARQDAPGNDRMNFAALRQIKFPSWYAAVPVRSPGKHTTAIDYRLRFICGAISHLRQLAGLVIQQHDLAFPVHHFCEREPCFRASGDHVPQVFTVEADFFCTEFRH